MKKRHEKKIFFLTALLVILIALVFSILSLVSYPYTAFQGLATQGSATLTVTIVSEETNLEVPASGNITFNDTEINARITTITNCENGKKVNLTLFGSQFPSSWTEPEPNSSQAGSSKIEFFEVVMNYNSSGGSYQVFFNLTQAELGSLPAANISLFVFDSVWTNLSTTVINGSSNPAQFSAVTTHFSKFLIAQRATPTASGSGSQSESGSGTGAGSGSGGGGGGSSSGSKKSTEDTEKPREEVPEEKAEPTLKPIHKPGILFDVSLTILEGYRKLFSGGTLIGEITLINIKKIGLVPVQIEYLLQDVEGNTLFHIYETKTVENEITFIKEVALPADLQPGDYMFSIKVNYGEDIALAGYPFEVIEKSSALAGLATFLTNPKIIVVAIPLMVMLIVVIIMILYFMHRKNKKARTKIKPNNQPMQKLKSLYRK